eukprot:4137556-Alexandrium_andersonii.AAC.1
MAPPARAASPGEQPHPGALRQSAGPHWQALQANRRTTAKKKPQRAPTSASHEGWGAAERMPRARE